MLVLVCGRVVVGGGDVVVTGGGVLCLQRVRGTSIPPILRCAHVACKCFKRKILSHECLTC